eukprot:TRINITY_DN12619_c0_g6_i1.p1 TRINITY_DN12619_c0_g6~~TRINITY_DN12619_c0_g6_i1.p1  ORF type:complete len:170 (-),score=22.39 TRINITY_DN12619_c0_g6_i1:245-754(-)
MWKYIVDFVRGVLKSYKRKFREVEAESEQEEVANSCGSSGNRFKRQKRMQDVIVRTVVPNSQGCGNLMQTTQINGQGQEQRRGIGCSGQVAGHNNIERVQNSDVMIQNQKEEENNGNLIKNKLLLDANNQINNNNSNQLGSNRQNCRNYSQNQTDKKKLNGQKRLSEQN